MDKRKAELIKAWTTAIDGGTFLTPKHDPNNVGVTTYASPRTVLTHQLSASLESFIDSGEYTLKEYNDANYPRGAGYFEVIPDSGSAFTVVGSGVQASSHNFTHPCDRLVVCSGSNQGWHLFAETESNVNSHVANGRLSLRLTIEPDESDCG